METKAKPRLQEKYEKEVAQVPASPRILKVVINMGIGKEGKNKEAIESLKKEIAMICGQSPAIKPAKISVASFNIRAGMPVGLAVTLRKERMYAFLDRLFSVVLPRLRDFRGLSKKGFDQSGNYTLGIAEHTVFPEIDLAKSSPHGLEITIVTNTKDPVKSEKLLTLLGMPFEKGGTEGPKK